MSSRWTVGKWAVDFEDGSIRERKLFTRPVRIDRRLLKVLEVLVNRAGETVSPEEILRTAWEGRVVSVESVSTAIYQLRKLLGDDAKSRRYILTVPQEGYKLVAASKVAFGSRPSGYAAAGAVITVAMLIAVGGLLAYPLKSATPDTVYIAPIVNSTGDPSLHDLSVAVDAVFVSALVRSDSDLIATRSLDVESDLRLDSEVVACDSGPALVLTLVDVKSQRYVWSEYFGFNEDYDAPSMVEHAAKRVAQVLART